MKENEVFTASPELKLFFENLLDLKRYVNKQYEISRLPVLEEISKRLDLIIQEGN